MKRNHKIILLIVALNLVFRLILVWKYAIIGNLYYDSYHHLAIAKSIYEGRGLVVDVIWPLILRSDSFPMTYYFRQPVYLYLTALSFRIFGPGIYSAQLVNILFESLIAGLVYIIALELTGSGRISIVSAVFYSGNVYALTYLPQVLSDTVFSFFVLLTLYLMIKFDGVRGLVITGVALGLAYLTRISAFVLIPVVFIYYSLKAGARNGVGRALTVVLVALVVSSPWLYRNYASTGNPFYNHFHAIGFLIPMREDELFSRLEINESIGSMILGRINTETCVWVLMNCINLVGGCVFFTPNPLVFGLGLLMVRDLYKRVAGRREFWASILAYFILSFLMTSTTFGRVRYLYPLVPFFSIASAIVFELFFVDKFKLYRDRIGRITYVTSICLMVLINITSAVYFMSNTFDGIYPALVMLEGRVGEEDVVMANFPYYVNYVFNARAVQIPSREKDFNRIIDQYGVDYVVHQQGWHANITDFSHLERIVSDGKITVYGVLK
ncbi:MAG: glycosyltransferase family 39 protein [Candidatus Altiarchaeota archaeon]